MEIGERERLRILFGNAFGMDGFGLEWICHEWRSGEFQAMADAAAELGFPEISEAIREAIMLQRQIDDLPG